ncbi:MAG TPA: tetratricopeptide repeat protein, partial [Candidatus Cybelea sp.]|nr:tetratricopeptide repeat protein [Candidatus Cybelea sp.]
MPILAVLMLLLEIGCAIHAGKTGRPQFWLYIIIALPGVGVLAYVLIELLPEYLGSYEGQRATQAVGRVVNPGRRYRALASEAEAAPTVENMLRLAEECVALARYDEAIGLFEHCLQGMHANDPKILLGLAEAQFGKGDAADAVATLDR